MSHKILDDKTDSQSIKSFIPATEVNLHNITIGTQIYYLYKEEVDSTILQWYWGCVIEIDKTRANGEYYHVWHDDEEPWIDLSKDKNDWKQIPIKHQLYDNTFDINDYLIINTSKKKTSKKRRKSNNKSKKKSNRKSISKSITNTIKSHKLLILPSKNNAQNYEISTRGYVEIIPDTPMTCTIMQDIIECEAVKIQYFSANNPYTLWVRREDIKQVLPNEKLLGQRISFELAGKRDRYKIIKIDEIQKFIQVFWNKDVNNTWIHIDNFYTQSETKSIASIILSPQPSSNKENEDEIDININDGDFEITMKQKRRKNREHKKRRSSSSRKKTNHNYITPTPSLSLTTSVSSQSNETELQKNIRQMRKLIKAKTNRSEKDMTHKVNKYSLSQPIDRSHHAKKRRVSHNNSGNTIHSAQITSDFHKYQQLHNNYNISPSYNTMSRSTSSTNVSIPIQTSSNGYISNTPQRQFLNSNNNAFTSPLRHTNSHSIYRYEANNIGQKRPRSTHNDILSDNTLPNKRQRLNNGNINNVNNNNNEIALRLLMMQPPQPKHLEMPELQPSSSPKAGVSASASANSNHSNRKMPSPDGEDQYTPVAPCEDQYTPVAPLQNNFADDVSSQSSDCGMDSQSPKSVSNNVSQKICINVETEVDGCNKNDNDKINESDTDSQDTEDTSNIEVERNNRHNTNNTNNRHNTNNNNIIYARHGLSEPPPNKLSMYNVNNGWNNNGYGHNNYNINNGFINSQYIDKRIVCFPMVSFEMITNKIRDKSISNQERIRSLKYVVTYLTNCQSTMKEMWGKIGSQCNNVIKCVEGIIKDLEQRC